MLCGIYIIALLVLHPPQPQGCSPPGSALALLCCCGLLRLAVMLDGRYSAVAGVQIGSSWTSAVALPQALSVGLDLWGWISGSPVLPPLCAWDLQMHVRFWTEGAVPNRADGSVDGGAAVPSMLTDRPSIYSLLCLLSCMFIPLCQVSFGTLKGTI